MKLKQVEHFIELNKCTGKSSQFKARIQEKDSPEFYYRQTVEGIKFGPLGIYERDGLWHVLHARSGRELGLPFSTESDARRLVFLLKDLARWSKVDWKDDRAYEADELFWLCVTASEYCNGMEGDYAPLVAAIQARAPDSSPVAFIPESVEIGVVEFGVSIT